VKLHRRVLHVEPPPVCSLHCTGKETPNKKDLEEDKKWTGYGLQTGKGWEGQAHTGPR
jgi:hypothetical protein